MISPHRIESLAEALSKTGAVEFIEPNFYVFPDAVPNDPMYPQQWHMEKIGMPIAWDIAGASTGVTVGVCDTGVDSTHPELQGKLVLPGWNTVSRNTDTSPTSAHGTLTSGVIVSQANNNLGIAGVSWYSKVYPIKVSNEVSGAATYQDLTECVNQAVIKKLKVVSMSYNGSASSALDRAAQKLKRAGGLLFVSSGNNGQSQIGSDYASMIVVGATSSGDVRSTFSTYGNFVDIVAPGEMISSVTPNNGYGAFSGTSFSAPLAAGVAALIFSYKPTLGAALIEKIIYDSAVDVGLAG
jgi:thermitase